MALTEQQLAAKIRADIDRVCYDIARMEEYLADYEELGCYSDADQTLERLSELDREYERLRRMRDYRPAAQHEAYA